MRRWTSSQTWERACRRACGRSWRRCV